MPRAGFEPGSLSEHLLEFDTRSKLLGHHGRLTSIDIHLQKFQQTVTWHQNKVKSVG